MFGQCSDGDSLGIGESHQSSFIDAGQDWGREKNDRNSNDLLAAVHRGREVSDSIRSAHISKV